MQFLIKFQVISENFEILEIFKFFDFSALGGTIGGKLIFDEISISTEPYLVKKRAEMAKFFKFYEIYDIFWIFENFNFFENVL